MKLPADNVAAGKAALQALWDDRATVLRKQRVGNVMQDVEVLSNVLCHLSQSSPPAHKQGSSTATASPEFTLYVGTEVDIHLGDSLVITHKGQIFHGTAGEPFKRNFSIVVRVEGVKLA